MSEKESKESAGSVAERRGGAVSRPSVLAVVLGVLGVILAAVGLVGLYENHDLRNADSARNRALADTAETTEVEGQVSTALSRVLSYDYKKPAATNAAAKEYLVGDAEQQYATLFDALRDKAKDQELTYEAETVVAGVKSLRGDEAELLVFLDQRSTRATDNASTIAAAQIAISAEKIDGAWKISGINPI